MATLSVTLTESLTVGSEAHSFSIEKSIIGANAIFKQNVVAGSAMGEVFRVGAASGLGQVAEDTLLYFRITNNDLAEEVIVQYMDATDNYVVTHLLLPGTSHYFFTDETNGIEFETKSDSPVTLGTAKIDTVRGGVEGVMIKRGASTDVSCTIFAVTE
tara:strand:- start:113 stop:586 length:474 start_codon:yes stop_codon:yes gene_type:complete